MERKELIKDLLKKMKNIKIRIKNLLLIYILLIVACYSVDSDFNFTVEELTYLDKKQRVQLVIPKKLTKTKYLNIPDENEIKFYFFSNKDMTETLKIKFYYNGDENLLSEEHSNYILNASIIPSLQELYGNNLEIINKSFIKNTNNIQTHVEYSFIDENRKKNYGLSAIKSWVGIDVKIDFSKQLNINDNGLKKENKKNLKLINLISLMSH